MASLLEAVSTLPVAAMCRQLELMKKERLKISGSPVNMKSVGVGRCTGDFENHQHQQPSHHQQQQQQQHESYECVALHISPDLGERIMLSGERALLDEVFPETNQALLDARSSVAWNQHDSRHVIRFPLNGYCKLNSVQAITRLLNAGFRVAASNGGGVEGQQFSEYLFVRKVFPV